MNATAPNRDLSNRVEIRIRRIIGRDGTESTQMSVFCPVRAASVPLEECRNCPSCRQVTIDANERDSFVTCEAMLDGRYSPARFSTPYATALNNAPMAAERLRVPVMKLMTRNVVCISPDLSLNDLVMVLIEHGISGTPVVNADGKAIGVVSKTDVLRDSYEKLEVAEHKSARKSLDADDEVGSRLLVREVMSARVLSLPESASVAEAAALMALEGVRRIPIVDDLDRVVGIVCATDVLTWLAREAGYVVPPRFTPRR
jgi:CBS domain-containing protein